MGRPPVNDPSNLPDNPKYSSDPAVTNRLVSEFRNRMAYLTQSYHLSKALIPTTVEFNEDLKRLERGLSRKRLASDRGTRLNAALETAITCEAMSLAVQEGSEDLEPFVKPAARIVLDRMGDRRKRPSSDILKLHVTGLVAAVQEFSGKAVRVNTSKNSVYEPHFGEGVSQIIPQIACGWDEKVTIRQLVTFVMDIRKQYAGKPLRFDDVFPQYGLMQQMSAQSQAGRAWDGTYSSQTEDDVAQTNGQTDKAQFMLLPRLPIYCP